MPSPETPTPSPSKQTVLTVDDDEAVNEICRNFLEKAGFSVLTASGSSEALKICKQHPGPIHLLITDIVMPPPSFSLASSGNEFPHVHGHELAVRALRMRKDLRVLMMSGNLDNDLAGYGIHKDRLSFISKPFDYAGLINHVNEAIQAPPLDPESLMKQNTMGPKGADEWFD